jgi:putative transcriptional regulator
VELIETSTFTKQITAMKKKKFEELLGSVREAGAILRGQKKPSRRIVIRSSGVPAIRERTSLSQSEFAHLIGVSVKTLQNWEQDRRRPTGPAAALLRIISNEPQLAVKAIHRA